MRRLPIFLVIDVSESMAGDPIRNVHAGIQSLLDALMTDPCAMETAYLSVILFAGKTKVAVPLTSLLNFTPPKLPVGAGTSLSAALETLTNEIERNVRKNTPESKGDWRPLVFLLTDGAPTDRYSEAVRNWKRKFDGKISIVAVLMGTNSDATALKTLTNTVLVFRETTLETYREFFKWVSSSIQESSREIGQTGKMARTDSMIRNLEKDLLAEELPTENTIEHLVLTVRCGTSKKPYIIRMVREKGKDFYRNDGVYEIDESYFEMSDPEIAGRTLSPELLPQDLPACPYCGNRMLGYAGCGKLLCLHSQRRTNVQCPWCGEIGSYNANVEQISGGLG